MKTTRMTVDGAKGWANITRREVAGRMAISIHGDGAAGLFDFGADPRASSGRAASKPTRR